jgi:hypothetical protein
MRGGDIDQHVVATVERCLPTSSGTGFEPGKLRRSTAR